MPKNSRNFPCAFFQALFKRIIAIIAIDCTYKQFHFNCYYIFAHKAVIDIWKFWCDTIVAGFLCGAFRNNMKKTHTPWLFFGRLLICVTLFYSVRRIDRETTEKKCTHHATTILLYPSFEMHIFFLSSYTLNGRSAFLSHESHGYLLCMCVVGLVLFFRLIFIDTKCYYYSGMR